MKVDLIVCNTAFAVADDDFIDDDDVVSILSAAKRRKKNLTRLSKSL